MLITKDKALHSNMFLLIRSCGYMIQLFQKTLHSNMFLLILRLETELTKNNNLYIPICFY